MNIGCIIRSVGERTEGLCIESARRHLSESNIQVIRDVKPFSLALEKMFEIAKEKEYDWYFGLDADVVLVEDWLLKAKDTISSLKKDHYRIDFPVKDRFVTDVVYAGIHLYNHKFTEEAREILNQTRGENKPEGNIRHKISCPEHTEREIYLGYHGYLQYHRDIFSRFALRYKRDKRYVKKYEIFKEMDTEKGVAKRGWEYAMEEDVDFMHADSRSLYLSEYGYEIVPLNMTLNEFYKLIREIV